MSVIWADSTSVGSPTWFLRPSKHVLLVGLYRGMSTYKRVIHHHQLDRLRPSEINPKKKKIWETPSTWSFPLIQKSNGGQGTIVPFICNCSMLCDVTSWLFILAWGFLGPSRCRHPGGNTSIKYVGVERTLAQRVLLICIVTSPDVDSESASQP